MPSTSIGFPYPSSSDDPDVPADIQALADALNTFLNLPADAVASGAGSNVISSLTFAALPSSPVSVVMTNPSSVYNLEVDVQFGAWVAASNTALQLQGGVAASGGMSFAADSLGAGGPVTLGQVILTQNTDAHSAMSGFPVIIPAGAAAVTFTLQAKRTAALAGSSIFNNPFLNVQPRRFIKP
jgi:hypothetical protein